MISKNIKETDKIAQNFLKCLLIKKNKNACVVGLSGDLGAGKTAFTQAVAKNLGIKKRVNSPTFVIMKRYELSKKKSYKNFLADKTKPVPAGENFYNFSFFEQFYHLDAYRLKNEKELIHLGWKDIISNPENLVFVEWPENIIKSMPKKHHKVSIFHIKEGHRSFKIKNI